jgi:hypothetical protein
MSIDALNCTVMELLVGTLPFDVMLVETTYGAEISGPLPVWNVEL